jgi:hypothetical protein
MTTDGAETEAARESRLIRLITQGTYAAMETNAGQPGVHPFAVLMGTLRAAAAFAALHAKPDAPDLYYDAIRREFGEHLDFSRIQVAQADARDQGTQ